jgi:Na+-transporting methylmalonyl-CoA/oxaloacetate decarboxylase gamma subunit
LLNLSFAVLALFFIFHGGTPLAGPLEYKDFISIILTALGVMIAILALGLAVAAVWGFSELKRAVRRTARRTAEAELASTVPPLTRRLVEEWLEVKTKEGTITEDQVAAFVEALDPKDPSDAK